MRKTCRPSDAHTCAHHRLRNRNAHPPHRFLRDELPASLRPLTRQAQHVLSGELIARTNRCGTWSTDFAGGPCGLRSFVRVVCPKEEVLEREVVWLIFVLFGMSLGFLTAGCVMVSIGHASPRGWVFGGVARWSYIPTTFQSEGWEIWVRAGIFVPRSRPWATPLAVP